MPELSELIFIDKSSLKSGENGREGTGCVRKWEIALNARVQTTN